MMKTTYGAIYTAIAFASLLGCSTSEGETPNQGASGALRQAIDRLTADDVHPTEADSLVSPSWSEGKRNGSRAEWARTDLLQPRFRYQSLNEPVGQEAFGDTSLQTSWRTYARPAAYFWALVNQDQRSKYAKALVSDVLFECASAEGSNRVQMCATERYDRAIKTIADRAPSRYVRISCNHGSVGEIDEETGMVPVQACLNTRWRFNNPMSAFGVTRVVQTQRTQGDKPFWINLPTAVRTRLQAIESGKVPFELYGHVSASQAQWEDAKRTVPTGTIQLVVDGLTFTPDGASSPIFVYSFQQARPTSFPAQ